MAEKVGRMDNIILSICIPTYNRGNLVIKLLEFLDYELKNLSDFRRVEVIVGDNCSTDDTPSLVKSYINKLASDYSLSYYRNDRNLGLVGNLISLTEKVKGDYIWFLGDDDEYVPGIVGKVYEEVSKEMYPFIFINHSTYGINKNGKEIGFKSVIGDVDLEGDGKDVLWNIYKYSGTVMMYISACVYKASLLVEFITKNKSNYLAAPLFFSFYCASKGQIKVIENVLIHDDIISRASWSNSRFRVFYIEIPWHMIKMPSWGYDKKEVYSTIRSILNSNKRGYLLYYYQKITRK